MESDTYSRYHIYTDIFYDKDFLECVAEDYGNGNEFCSRMCQHMASKNHNPVCEFFGYKKLVNSNHQGPGDTSDMSPYWFYIRPDCCKSTFKLTESEIDKAIADDLAVQGITDKTVGVTDIGATTVNTMYMDMFLGIPTEPCGISNLGPKAINIDNQIPVTSKYITSDLKQQQRAHLLNTIITMAGDFDYGNHTAPQEACILFIKKVFYATVTLLDTYTDTRDSNKQF